MAKFSTIWPSHNLSHANFFFKKIKNCVKYIRSMAKRYLRLFYLVLKHNCTRRKHITIE
jgi:hypothetical protein